MNTAADLQYWEKSSKIWQGIRSPQKPHKTDVEIYQRSLNKQIAKNSCFPSSSFQALILGVTPEITTLSWPQSAHLTAVDHSQAMIDHIWHTTTKLCQSSVICANWCNMPILSHSTSFIIGDGCFILIDPNQWSVMLRSIHHILKTDGRFIIRVFQKPDLPLSISEIQSHTNDIHVLRWRIGHTIQPTLQKGVAVHDIWKTYQEISAQTEVQCQFINNYRNDYTKRHFPTRSEFEQAIEPYFYIESVSFGKYELSELCPIYELSPKPYTPN